ncbi:hypothetical protein GOBAR_DD12031 [Gossypium barbadense]|nr:hypothetical protein GOBAR_DD12031 [Gossypium barbadense]
MGYLRFKGFISVLGEEVRRTEDDDGEGRMTVVGWWLDAGGRPTSVVVWPPVVGNCWGGAGGGANML